MPEAPRTAPARDWTLAYVMAAAIGAVALLALLTAPVADLLGDSEYAIPAALHGVSSIVYVIVATILAYLAVLMYTGRLQAYRDLRMLSLLAAFFSLVTVLFGNWIYIAYRAPTGPRSYFLETQPSLHQVFFEFKEFLALFTVPLSIATAFAIWRERDTLSGRPALRQAIAAMLLITWAALMLTFGLGAAITKLRGV